MATEAESNIGTELTRETLTKLNISELENMSQLLFGLKLPRGLAKVELIDRILSASTQAKGNREMKIVEKDEKVEVPKGHVKIRVNPGDYNPNHRPVPVGLNFRMALIPVNKDVVMPGKWLPCLQDAVTDKYTITRNAAGKEELTSHQEHRYPFTILVDNR